MQFLYQGEVLQDWSHLAQENLLKAFYSDLSAEGNEALEYASKLYALAVADLAKLDTEITALNLSWSLSRLSKIEHAILRLALAESYLDLELDRKIIINEAVNLAKEYAAVDSHRFINAALDQALIAKVYAGADLKSTTNRKVKPY